MNAARRGESTLINKLTRKVVVSVEDWLTNRRTNLAVNPQSYAARGASRDNHHTFRFA
jgi:hypothetical protein